MRAVVLVRPKAGILDPQGEAVESSLRQLGFTVGEARVGKVIDLEVAADRLAHHAFAFAAGIHLGVVEEVHAGVERRVQYRH